MVDYISSGVGCEFQRRGGRWRPWGRHSRFSASCTQFLLHLKPSPRELAHNVTNTHILVQVFQLCPLKRLLQTN